MSESHCEIFCHFVWATKDRQPMLKGDLRDRVHACIREECSKKRAEIIALNSVEDHVHLFVRLASDLTCGELAQRTKGVSSHLVRNAHGRKDFRWQEGYAVFSISKWDVQKSKSTWSNKLNIMRIIRPKRCLSLNNRWTIILTSHSWDIAFL